MLDISDPTNPQEVGYSGSLCGADDADVDGVYGAVSVDVQGSLVFMSDTRAGLVILQLPQKYLFLPLVLRNH